FLAEPELTKKIDKVAAKLKLDRSKFIRLAVEQAIKKYEDMGMCDVAIVDKKALKILEQELRRTLQKDIMNVVFDKVIEEVYNILVTTFTTFATEYATRVIANVVPKAIKLMEDIEVVDEE
ncbi:MAG TPA: ribbon-helix-helix protein, CopG family, partial [Deltaproteobacteria bacterium]|nr:ribbon-helix-helix protein, CopG family [Deltaproteobacteria bacterium]